MSRYIALEGIDGAGKTHAQGFIADRLEAAGHEVVRVREPGGTPVGMSIRRILLGDPILRPWSEAMLFAADRAQLVADVIAPALERGAWVVSDRSVYSSLAYQGAGRGLGVEEIRRLNEPALHGIHPGLVVLLRVSPRTGLARQRRADHIGREESSLPSEGRQLSMEIEGTEPAAPEGRAFLAVVSEAFDELARRAPERFQVIDAEQPLEKVEADLWAAVEAAL